MDEELVEAGEPATFTDLEYLILQAALADLDASDEEFYEGFSRQDLDAVMRRFNFEVEESRPDWEKDGL